MRKTLIVMVAAFAALMVAGAAHADTKNEAFKYLLDAYKAVGREQYDDALDLFDKALELDPTNAKAYEGKASIYNFRQDLGGAVENYGKALENDPSNLDYAYQYAILLGAQGRNEESLAVLDGALGHDPENRILMGYKGAVLNILHRFEDAEALYIKGTELYPEDGGMYSGLGYSQVGLEKYDDAVTNLQSAITLLGKRDRNTWVALGMALRRRGSEEDVKKSTAILVGVIKGGGGIDEHAICALGLLGQRDDMLKALEALLKERPTARSILRGNLKLKDYWDDPDFKKLVEG